MPTPRKKINEIRHSKSWGRRMSLAMDALPETKFDALFECVTGSLRQLVEMRNDGRAGPCFRATYVTDAGIDLESLNSHTLQNLGEIIAGKIEAGESSYLREMADAIDARKQHMPKPDRLRLAIIRYCIPPNKTFQMRDLLKHLRELRLDKDFTEFDPNVFARRVRTLCKELDITIKGKAGKPTDE